MSDSKHVVLTGAGRGLGLAMARQMIAEGHCLNGCSRTQASVERLRGEFGLPNRFEQVDVADFAAVRDWSRQVLERAGPPDLLLNNAATINANAVVWEIPPDEFAEVVNVNVTGSFNVIRSFLPAMIERGAGVIVNFSSGWGRSTSPEVGPYCASKWAIEALTASLAAELPGGLAAVALNPGVIHTEMLESCFGSQAAAYPSPEEWACRAVPFLLGLTASSNGKKLTAP